MPRSTQNNRLLATDPDSTGATVGEARPAARRSPVLVRFITGTLMLPMLWATLMVFPAWAFYGVALSSIGIACWESYRILDARGTPSFRWLGILACLAVAGSFTGTSALSDIRLPFVLVGALAALLAMRRLDKPEAMLEATLKTVFPVVFVGLSLGYLIGIYEIPGGGGGALLLFLYLCIVLSDSLAFCVGSVWGKHPMAPRLSPKKTWEGAAAGLAGSVIGAMLAHGILQEPSWWHTLALGLLIGVAGILGDMAESLLKRAYGVKDSSALLPGHGGFLDRMDSQLLAAPLLYYYYTVLVVGS